MFLARVQARRLSWRERPQTSGRRLPPDPLTHARSTPQRRACSFLSDRLLTVRLMRLLHTSDWHLGRSFHGVDMLSAQERALDGLVGVVRAEQVAAVIVAGDL